MIIKELIDFNGSLCNLDLDKSKLDPIDDFSIYENAISCGKDNYVNLLYAADSGFKFDYLIYRNYLKNLLTIGITGDYKDERAIRCSISDVYCNKIKTLDIKNYREVGSLYIRNSNIQELLIPPDVRYLNIEGSNTSQSLNKLESETIRLDNSIIKVNELTIKNHINLRYKSQLIIKTLYVNYDYLELDIGPDSQLKINEIKLNHNIGGTTTIKLSRGSCLELAGKTIKRSFKIK